jgi:cell division protein FtsW
VKSLHLEIGSNIKRAPPDFLLLSVIFALMGIGLVTIYSSSSIYALDRFGNSTYFLVRQLIWIALGMAAAVFFMGYDHQKLKQWVPHLMVLCLICLVLVLFMGRTVGGARRWLRIGGLGFQPSELAKLTLILFTAYYCDKKRSKIGQFARGLMPILGVLGFYCGMIFLQPDLGTPVLILLTCVTMIFIGGASTRQLMSLAMPFVFLVGLAAWLEPYRRRRILAFLHPWENAQGRSYQLVQSLLALGSGGLTGVGLGESRSKLLYLPEPHTDFIFPIFAEEFGLAGSWFIIALFGLMAWAGYRIASRATNLFSTLLASGITLMILYQTIYNIAMVTGCLPTKGLPLPFISFGGSSLLVTLASMGILLNISKNAER